jgi:hypothetical protein
MASSHPLFNLYVPPESDYVLESLIATTYRINWDFVEEDLLPVVLAVRSPVSRMKFFRSEFERRLESCDVSILYDLRAAERNDRRLSPRIDALPVSRRKLHAKVSLLLWTGGKAKNGRAPKFIRLIIGSANLTRQGFRENHEVAAALDFSDRGSPNHAILESAIDLILKAAQGTRPKQLDQQISAFRRAAKQVPRIRATDAQPRCLVSAEAVLSKLSEGWKTFGGGSPETVVIASPFWPSGDNVADPIISIVKRVGLPKRIELICQSTLGAHGGALLPVMPSALPGQLRAALTCRVFVRPSIPTYGTSGAEASQADDLTEDSKFVSGPAPQVEHCRELHAKVIAICGRQGSALYVGSSNCTRRGLGSSQADGTIAGNPNWEAGLIYLLGGRHQSFVKQLTAFAGSPIEVPPDGTIPTWEPKHEPDLPAPTFLQEVVVEGTRILVRFQDSEDIPADLSILMPDPTTSDRYFLLVRAKPRDVLPKTVELSLNDCVYVNEKLETIVGGTFNRTLENVSTWVEVRWRGQSTCFPVRFDEKSSLPRVPGSRRATLGELLEYFLLGREPWTVGGDYNPNDPSDMGGPEDPVDTRFILSYFIRKFVEAIPGLEAEILRAVHSGPALRATLFGPTGAIRVAEKVSESYRNGPAPGEPNQTPVSAAFQLIEIIAALRRCTDKTSLEASTLIKKAIGQCEKLLKDLAVACPELRGGTLEEYRCLFKTE